MTGTCGDVLVSGIRSPCTTFTGSLYKTISSVQLATGISCTFYVYVSPFSQNPLTANLDVFCFNSQDLRTVEVRWAGSRRSRTTLSISSERATTKTLRVTSVPTIDRGLGRWLYSNAYMLRSCWFNDTPSCLDIRLHVVPG